MREEKQKFLFGTNLNPWKLEEEKKWDTRALSRSMNDTMMDENRKENNNKRRKKKKPWGCL